jgi:hypothetical protein
VAESSGAAAGDPHRRAVSYPLTGPPISDNELHLLCAEGSEAFEALPVAIRNLGHWAGSKEDEIGHLRFRLRSLLIDQGFVIVHAHVGKLNVENPIGAHGLHPLLNRQHL